MPAKRTSNAAKNKGGSRASRRSARRSAPTTIVGTVRGDIVGVVLVVLAVVVRFIGWSFHRRYSRYNRRRAFAEAHGLDPFDQEAVDKAMEEAGLLDRRKQSWF